MRKRSSWLDGRRGAALLLFFALFCCTPGCSTVPAGYPYKVESLFGVDDPQFVRTMGHVLGPPLVDGNTVETLVNGDRIFPAMLDAIRSAKMSVTFETFIYWKGKTGNAFTDALCDRAKDGVKVHLLLDAVGSRQVDEKYLDRMRAAGCEVQIYHPLRWFDLSSAARLNHRTHRKLLIVDGKVGFTGGVGIADDWSGNAQDKDHWRDTHYRLTGPAVADLQAAFTDHWVETSSRLLQGDLYFPRLESVGKHLAQVFKSEATGGSESMQLMYLISFASAHKEIRLATAYFVPDELTIQTLLDAKKRGVRVRVVVPGPKTDVPLTRAASRASWGALLRGGVEIYEFEPTMFHVKLLVIDGLWVSIGSANIDNRSFSLNGEANLNVLDAAFATRQSQIFDDDIQHSRQITYEAWTHRPFGEKLKEGFASIFKWQL